MIKSERRVERRSASKPSTIEKKNDQPAFMQQENKMGIMPIPRLVLSMSVPIMISMLVQSMYNIVDSIFVARINEAALTILSSLIFVLWGLFGSRAFIRFFTDDPVIPALRIICIILLPFVFLFGKIGGISLIWFAFWISEACAVAYAIWQLKKNMKRVQTAIG